MTVTYAVKAHNTAPDSDNKIHSDDVAKQYGFKGGLVPGVTVYAYMVRPVAETWGRKWVEHGSMHARLARPLYEGDAASVEFDDESGDIRVTNGAGDVCATGQAGWSSMTPPPIANYPEMPLPEARPAASPESLAPHTQLGSLEAGFHADRADEYLDPIADDLPLWRSERIAHPGYLVSFANYILTSNVKVGPWIHVETTANHFSAVTDGDRWSMRGHVLNRYERKGHKFVELDLLVVANDERPVMAIHHTAIYEPRTSA